MFRSIQHFFGFRKSGNNETPFTIANKIDDVINFTITPHIMDFLLFAFIGINCFDLYPEVSFPI